MAHPRFAPGERIRAVEYKVDVTTEEGRTVKQVVTLRYRWAEGTPTPIHSCVANLCAYCIEKATLQALRRQSGVVASVFATRDRQTTAR